MNSAFPELFSKRRDKHAAAKGFTLLELLIVISILVVLSAILIFALNPVETLKKSRDAQRLADLSTLKNAIGLYLTSTSSPYLAGIDSNAGCKTASSYSSGDTVYYSYPSDSPGATITDTTIDGGSASLPSVGQVSYSSLKKTDTTGWIPILLSGIRGGSPISNLPVDPINTVTTLTALTSSDLVYRYACDASDMTFEIDANLESATFTTDPDNRETNDGGNNSNLYEIGTKLNILGTGIDL